eukprot:5332848-Amphidinium_carterae.2
MLCEGCAARRQLRDVKVRNIVRNAFYRQQSVCAQFYNLTAECMIGVHVKQARSSHALHDCSP